MNPASGGELRVVLDTNVYISAFAHPERPIYQVWRHALERRYQLLISSAIVNELADVLRTDFHWEERRLRRRIRLVTRVGTIITPYIALNVIPDDPDDDRILECAPPAGLRRNSHYQANRCPPNLRASVTHHLLLFHAISVGSTV